MSKYVLIPWDGTDTQEIPDGSKRRGCGGMCACSGACKDLVPLDYSGYDWNSEADLADKKAELRKAQQKK